MSTPITPAIINRVAAEPSPTRTASYGVVAPLFAQKFGRQPLPPTDPSATINDFIFARMIEPHWPQLTRALVDKSTAKAEAARLYPGLRAAETLATIDMDSIRSPVALYDELLPFISTDAVAKPTQASGGTVFLRDVSTPVDLATTYALASTEYSLVMREMQYWQMHKRVIVEACVPTANGLPPDDLKFHCVRGEPLLCQVDHARIGATWSRVLRVPGFAPMDSNDGLVPPASVTLPHPDRLSAMIRIARALAEPFDYVRVDLYDGIDDIYFGELTFTPAASLGIAPSAAGCHRETETHREYSRTLMRALRDDDS